MNNHNNPLFEKRTKIVCTIGPATESSDMLEKLLNAGMNVMRLNFSHGDFEEHEGRIKNLETAIQRTGKTVAVLQDLGGPKIRIGTFKNESVMLEPGQIFTLTTDTIEGDKDRVSINYSKLPQETAVGHHIYLHDGRKKLEVVEIKGNDVVCKVLVGGEIKGKRGVNLPNSDLTISSITDKDRKDLEFGIKHKVDFIALSFVRKPEDIIELRKMLDEAGSKSRIIAKIETPQAVANIDKIIELSDGIMVARGDLAIEIPTEDVPSVQKRIVKKCNAVAKPVITATQMLESMIKNPVPTRAEVSDVANAILDGTDAIMLSEETTLGEFPVEAVETMTKIAKRTEKDLLHIQFFNTHEHGLKKIGESITASAVRNADRIGAKALVAFTMTGKSARMMCRHKPHQPVLVFTPFEDAYKAANLSFGCVPILIPRTNDFNRVMQLVREYCLKNGLAIPGDRVVIASGAPFDEVRETNMIVVETI